MKYAVILNPAAGHGRAGRHRARLEKALRAAGMDYRLLVTERPKHATELARAASADADVVVAVGGDGTIHEVGQGLAEAGGRAALGIIPDGTGNDLVRTLRIPRDMDAAVAILRKDNRRPMDYGAIQWEEEGRTRQGTFMNVVGAGVDAAVARKATTFKGFPGKSAYLFAIPGVLAQWRTPTVQVSVGGEAFYEGPMFLMTVANGRTSGGGFYLTPDARQDDGRLDLCLVEKLSTMRVLQLLPKALKGTHTAEREVHMQQVKAATLVSEQPFPIHADGEVLAASARRLEVRVVPGGLTVVVPA